MNRRDFLRSSSAAALGSLTCSSPKTQSNVLIIYTDEHARWTLGVYGDKVIGTPHLDSIGNEGAVFDNFFVNSAVCTPSRGCFITGRYPHAHGAPVNNIPINRDEITLAEVLRRNGYETAMIGKWHLDGEPRPGWTPADRAMGFEDSQWMFNRGHWKRVIERPEAWPNNRSVSRTGKEEWIPDEPDGRPDLDYDVRAEGQYFTDWLADKTIEFLERPRNRPFFLYLSIPDPHTPFSVGPPYDAMFRPEDMEVPETLYEEPLPDWAAKARANFVRTEKSESWDDPNREAVLRQRKSQYFGMVKRIDDNVGRILEILRNKKILDDTLIVFCSDHGQYMGEHGLYMKNQLYEPAHRVALMMRLPARIPAGTRVEECVSTVDVQPTVLSLLGLDASGREQGRDASRLTRGEPYPDWQNEAFIHHSSLERAGIFTPEWQFALVKNGDGILFDRRNDPLQTDNLFAAEDSQEVVAELTRRVVEHHRLTESPALGWLAELEVG